MRARQIGTWPSKTRAALAKRLPGKGSDGGWLSLEFVGMSFLFLFSLMLALQVASATYTMAQANGAARAAARAATLRGSGQSAANEAVNPSLRPVQVSGGSSGGQGQTWSVTLRVPQVVPLMPRWTVTRSASMPNTEVTGG
jgi:hypothetical protein